jgi:hypothetical protein
MMMMVFQTRTQQTEETPTLQQAHTVYSTKNMEQVEYALHDDIHQTICCQWNRICEQTLRMQAYRS